VSFDVAPGEFVSLIGPSGCGKSTLFNIIGGLLGDYEGRVASPATTVTGTHPSIGMVFQEESTFPWRTVLDNVAFPLEIAGLGSRARSTRRALRQARRPVGLRAPLSVGAVGRHAPARRDRAHARLRAEDPADGRAVRRARRADALLLGDKVLQIQQELKQTTLLITHNLTEAVQLSDRVLVMTYRPAGSSGSSTSPAASARRRGRRRATRSADTSPQIWHDLREEASRGIEATSARARAEAGLTAPSLRALARCRARCRRGDVLAVVRPSRR
jgi:NitT/TauT family transport system ATP-binding protein